jgi:hypothetical protein
VATARSLGVTFADGSQPAAAWDSFSAGACGRLGRLAGAGLSAFGRAFGASAYASSTFLTAAQHHGLSPAALQLQRHAAALVDRGLAPRSHQRVRTTGVPGRLLVGHPTTGGFGLLPLVQHVCARWAVAACRLICVAHAAAPRRPPPFWVPMAAAVLAAAPGRPAPLSLFGARLPAVGPAGAGAGALPTLAADPLRAALPACLTRLACGLASLPPPVDIGSSPLVPGAWCFNCPLWGNPLLLHHGLPLEHSPAAAILLRGLPSPPATVAELLTAPTDWLLWLHPRDPAAAPRLSQSATHRILDAVTAADELRRVIPAAWADAVIAVRRRLEPPPPSREEVAALLVGRLGWRVPGLREPVPLRALTVRLATQLQLGPLQSERAGLHARYLAEALDSEASPAQLAAFAATLARVWRLRWYNSHKETLWRLALDGVGQLGSCHVRVAPPPCPCGRPVGAGPRLHAFWECSAAEAVRSALSAVLGAPLSRAQLWLLHCPAGLEQSVWDVVALAALSALEVGRRRLRGGATPAVVHAHVVGDFWGRLRSFVALGKAPASWTSVSPLHPFVGRAADGSLVLNR